MPAQLVSADFSVESALFARGFSLLAGMDEVGRGPLAGPATVGVAVVTPETQLEVEGLIDSKALTEKKRLAMVPQIRSWVPTAVGSSSPAEIDSLGITMALRLAGQRALAQVAAQGIFPDAVLLDGKHDWLTPPEATLFADQDPATTLYETLVQEAWAETGSPAGWFGPVQMEIKGDYRCASIAAASVVAKVDRDAEMDRLHELNPAYEWGKNKGYGSAAHRAAITDRGPSPYHRLSWSLPATAEQIQQAYTARLEDDLV
ncbi:ribonuclease HII [Rothia nasimurium]|uniref:ribonuclease HII n=1 Tax=Rothia nasimurium TaxID=85336 RepID=UPI001F03081F|nr:ribonuclease HII [Rothia nasimurium]